MRLKIFIAAAALAALSLPAFAQRTGVTITDFASLPATCTPGQPFVVSDANATCTAGSGSPRWCICNATGNGYDPDPGGTPSADSVGTSQLNDGSDSPSTSQLVAVDSAASTQFEYLAIDLGLTNDGDNFGIDFAQTLAGNPALNADECIFVATASGGGFLCEGSAANTNEQLYLFPDLDGADTTDTIATLAATQTFTNKTLTTPTIGDFTNAGHDHSNAAGGGDVALGAASTVTTASEGDNDTSPASTAFVTAAIDADEYFGMFDVFPDGTQCGPAFGKTVNSGPVTGAINCADNAASVVYFNLGHDQYQGGTLVFRLIAVNENASPSGVLDFDFSCQCRGDSDALNSTWGTAQNASITFDTQYDQEIASTAAVTPDGTCAADDVLYCRAVMDAVSTTTQVADTYLIGLSTLEQ